MKKNWQKPTITIFNDSSINSADGNPLNCCWENVQYCDAGVVKFAAGTGTIDGFQFRTANSPNANGRVGGGAGLTAVTAGVSGC